MNSGNLYIYIATKNRSGQDSNGTTQIVNNGKYAYILIVCCNDDESDHN